MSNDSPHHVRIERKGGLAGFGLPGSRVRSRGVVDLRALSPTERDAVEKLFTTVARPPEKKPVHADAFEYHLTRSTPDGDRTVIISEQDVPDAVRDAVEDAIE